MILLLSTALLYYPPIVFQNAENQYIVFADLYYVGSGDNEKHEDEHDDPDGKEEDEEGINEKLKNDAYNETNAGEK